MASMDDALPLVDSHIHLYALSHIKDLAWASSLPESHVLKRRNSIEDWLDAIAQSASKVLGFVFVETDRKSGLDDNEWDHALDEVQFLARICSAAPLPDEGHKPQDKNLVLGIVPWAPIAAGKPAVNQYLQRAKRAAGSEHVWNRVKGFRYLVQDKPRGTMLQSSFVEGLLALEDSGIKSFDLGIDARSGGLWQLQEAGDMLDRFYSMGQGNLNIVVNHMCKPNLQLEPNEIESNCKDYEEWKAALERFARFPTTYMKLSGLFSELPPQSEDNPTAISELVGRTKPWVDAIFNAFGPSRILFGSDWPVCNLGGPGASKSWQHWYNFVHAVLQDQNLSRGEKALIWSGSAVEAYDLNIDIT